jgi:antitoxin ParD1/3/4
MPVRKTRNVSLTPELEAFIDNRVASGRYGNASEVVRAALRLLIEQEQKARATKASNRQ